MYKYMWQCVCVYVCMHVCMYVLRTYVCRYVRTYLYVYVSCGPAFLLRMRFHMYLFVKLQFLSRRFIAPY
jgi:ABC-type multidrug transport system fused ATPase/permease subunit